MKDYLKIFIIGALGYGLLETLFRGYTHWTMLLAGGICLITLYLLNQKYERASLLHKCLWGALIITSIEFIVGCVVNLWLGWNVWDYSKFKYNILGQICLTFTIIWFLLCVPLSYFVRILNIHFLNRRVSVK